MKRPQYLEVALEAAEAAAQVLMTYYNKQISCAFKADQSPVTIADTEAENTIVDIIKKAFPEHGLLCEESGEHIPDSEYTWIIDPIDGTKNYMRGIPLFATQIALSKNGRLMLGISNAPALNELLFAKEGRGAFCNGERIVVSNTKELANAYLSFGNLKHFESISKIPTLIRLAEVTRNPRGIGDAWSYHLLSQGHIDIMLDAKTSIWDIAALTVIVEEAGGKVTDFMGSPVTMETTSIIATNSILHDTVLQIIGSGG